MVNAVIVDRFETDIVYHICIVRVFSFRDWEHEAHGNTTQYIRLHA